MPSSSKASSSAIISTADSLVLGVSRWNILLELTMLGVDAVVIVIRGIINGCPPFAFGLLGVTGRCRCRVRRHHSNLLIVRLQRLA
uniref:Candidate secreted effector n=1 Tax=Meloidogyne incognita TaxID=6306 RepID=A0A914NIA5_MELIC